MRNIYPYRIQIRHSPRVFLWVDGREEKDYLLTAVDNTFVTGRSKRDLQKRIKLKRSDKVFWDHKATFDVDDFLLKVSRLKPGTTSTPKTCKALNNGWNFMEDILFTIGKTSAQLKMRDKSLNKMYDKIFFGINLPAVTPEGREYNPVWTALEIRRFKKAIKEAIQYIKHKAPEIGF